MFGCVATGIIYSAIGIIALLSFFKLKDGGASENSFFALLDQFLVGKITLWLIALGAVGFVVWRFVEAFRDPYGYGKEFEGISKRVGAAFGSTADAFIAFSAVQAVLGTRAAPVDGSPVQERTMAASLLQTSWGEFALIGGGAVTMIVALTLALYVITRSFIERINMDFLDKHWRITIKILAYAGYAGRSIIVGIMGFFFVKAGMENNPQHVVNTDKAFDFIGDHVGHPFFIMVAVATICYGLFMFISGVLYDTDKDHS